MFLGFDSNIKWLDLQIKYHSLFNNRGFSHKAFWVGGWGMIGGIGGVPNGFIIGWWSPRRSWTENTCESPCNTTGRRFLLTMEGKSDLDGCCFGPRFIRSPSRTTTPGASSMASIWSTKMRKLQKITKWSKWYWKTRNVYYFYILIAFFGRLNGKKCGIATEKNLILVIYEKIFFPSWSCKNSRRIRAGYYCLLEDMPCGLHYFGLFERSDIYASVTMASPCVELASLLRSLISTGVTWQTHFVICIAQFCKVTSPKRLVFIDLTHFGCICKIMWLSNDLAIITVYDNLYSHFGSSSDWGIFFKWINLASAPSVNIAYCDCWSYY